MVPAIREDLIVDNSGNMDDKGSRVYGKTRRRNESGGVNAVVNPSPPQRVFVGIISHLRGAAKKKKVVFQLLSSS
jgi:hypothetical protein